MKVSVVMVVDDNTQYLEECIQSLSAQSMMDFELLVSFKASAVPAFMPQDPVKNTCKYFTGQEGGIAKRLNFLISQATTNIIVPIEPEDIQRKNKLKWLTETLELNPTVAATGTETEIIHADGTTSNGWIWTADNPKQAQHFCAIGKTCLPHSGSAFRKSVFEEVGRYNEDLQAVFDIDLWTRMVLAGHLVIGISGSNKRMTAWRKVDTKMTEFSRKTFVEERFKHRDRYLGRWDNWTGYKDLAISN